MRAAGAMRDGMVKEAVDKLADLLAEYEVESQDVPFGISRERFFDDLADRFGVALFDAVDSVTVEPFGEWVADRDLDEAADLERDRSAVA